MAKHTKADAIRIVTSCAERYQKELADKTLLFVCADKHRRLSCFAFSFYPWNFMHLTGLKPSQRAGKVLTANDFYHRCLAHKLSPQDFEFSKDGTTAQKLDVLPSVICKDLSANMIGEYHSSKPKLYTEKLAGGTKACVGFVRDDLTDGYVPNTVLKEDIRNHVAHYVRVVAVYRKPTGVPQYQELVFKAKKFDWAGIVYPEEYAYLTKLE